MKKNKLTILIILVLIFAVSCGFASAEEILPVPPTEQTSTTPADPAPEDTSTPPAETPPVTPDPQTPPAGTPDPGTETGTPAEDPVVPPAEAPADPAPEIPVEPILPPEAPVVVEETGDTNPPNRINDLSLERAGPKSADISWTVPDIDVKSYDVRISLKDLTESNWSKAVQITGGENSKEEGDVEMASLSDLPQNTTLYVAVRTYDKSGNPSPISNVLEIETEGKVEKSRIAELRAGGADDENLSPENSGVVRLVLQEEGTKSPISDELIFVNFINKRTGVSTGGAVTDGMLAMEIPAGEYTVKLILPPTLNVADELPTFDMEEGGDVDLGIVRLTPSGMAENTDGSLSFVIKLLFEIIKLLQEILTKLG